MKLSSFLMPITWVGVVLLSAMSAWENCSDWQRNLVLISRVRLFMDSSYRYVSELPMPALPGTGCRAEQADISFACEGKKIDAFQCARALMAAVDAGMSFEELVRHLGDLNDYPAEQSVVASYAGEMWYRQAVVDDAITVWQEWLHPLLRIDKARRLDEAGHGGDAILLIDSLDPEARIESDIRRVFVVRVLVQIAQESVEKQDYGAAAIYWRRATVQYPERESYHFNLAIALQRQGKLEEALISLREAVRLRPDSPSYQLRLAQVLYRLGRKEEAKEAAQRVLVLDPHNQAAKKLIEQIGE